MDKDLATIILVSCYRSARELGDLVPLIKENCGEDDRRALGQAIASVIYDIMENIGRYASAENPDLNAEIESRLSKYNRAF
jgi:hypothetical protein